MRLSVYCESPEMDDFVEAAAEAIGEWLKTAAETTELLRTEQRLGLTLDVKKSNHLKSPLKFLYDLAKKHKQEFVVAMQDEGSDEWEEVCFFGNEEGRPDAFEISCYLGL